MIHVICTLYFGGGNKSPSLHASPPFLLLTPIHLISVPTECLLFLTSFFDLPLLSFSLATLSAASAIEPGSAGGGSVTESTEIPLDPEKRRLSQLVGRAGRDVGSGGISVTFSLNRATFGG